MARVGGRRNWSRWVAIAIAVFWLGSGLWAFLAPRSFYDQLATFPPYNVHFLHDIGAFSIGLGAVIALLLAGQSGWRSGFFGVGIGSAVHVVSHVIDYDIGGKASDIAAFVVVTALTFAAGWREPAGAS